MGKLIYLKVNNDNILNDNNILKHKRDYYVKNILFEPLYTKNFIVDNINNYPFFISDYSKDKLELVLSVSDKFNEYNFDMFNESYINDIKQNLDINLIIKGDTITNNLITIVNAVQYDDDKLLIKLYEPIKSDAKNLSVNIVKLIAIQNEDILSFENKYDLEQEQLEIDLLNTPDVMLQPNFDIKFNEPLSSVTGSNQYISINDILNLNSVEDYSEIMSLIDYDEINADYSDFKSFIQFSSAKYRIENFIAKLEKIEELNLKIESIETYSKTPYIKQKNNILDGFDGYEHFLYFDTISEFKKSYGNISTLYSYPKDVDNKPLHTSNSISISWINNMTKLATLFDESNIFNILNMIPLYIKEDDENIHFNKLLLSMGQYFDYIVLVLKSLVSVKHTEQNFKLYPNKKLLDNMVKAMGLDTIQDFSDVYSYFLKNYDNIEMNNEDIKYEILNRLYNNNLNIRKSKGTKNSIEQLLSCYGIPNTLFDIQEYSNKYYDASTDDNFDYTTINTFLDVEADTTITSDEFPLTLPMTLTFNILVNDINGDIIDDIISINDGQIFLLNSNSSEVSFENPKVNVFDLSKPIQITLKMFSTDSLTMYTSQYINNTYKYNYAISSSFNTINSSFNISEGCGSIRELMIWNSYDFTDEDIMLQTKFPNRSSILNGSSPAENITKRLIYHKFTPESIYDELIIEGETSEDAQIEVDSLNFTKIYFTNNLHDSELGEGSDNKVRIINNESEDDIILSQSNKVASLSNNYKNVIDSNKVSIFFTPNKLTHQNIAMMYSDYSFDNLIGDYSYRDLDYYPELVAEQEAFELYNNSSSYYDYMDRIDNSVFSQIRKLVPKKVDLFVGTLIKPTVFERNKQKSFNEKILKMKELTTEGTLFDPATMNVNFINNLVKHTIQIDFASIEQTFPTFKSDIYVDEMSKIKIGTSNVLNAYDWKYVGYETPHHKYDGFTYDKTKTSDGFDPIQIKIINDNELNIGSPIIKLN